ncbi:MAG: hypothetical protein JJ863_16885 [Deltaproteobacteria bacterium]|nr:hypothetical protein [Deltaproteobacteria bacterium]
MKRLLLLALSWFLLAPLTDVAEAQVAVAELSGARADSVRQRLAARLQSAGFEVVPGDGDDAASIASATGARAVVTGRVRRRGGRWRADLQIHDASGEVRAEASASHRGIGGLAAQLARRIEDDVRELVSSGGSAAPAASSGGGAGSLVVGDFDGRGAARIRNQLVRSLAGDYELVARDDLAAQAARSGGDLGDPQALREAAAALGVRAFIDGTVSRSGRRWVLRVSVTDAATNNQISRETFRGSSSGGLARSVRSQGARKLADAIAQTSVPEGSAAAAPVDIEDPDDGDDDDDVVDDDGDDDIPDPPRDRSGFPVAIDIGVYGRVFHRELSYNDDLYGLLRGYTLQLGPAIELAGRWYPGAHFTDGFGAHIGIEASYERAFGIDSVPADPDDDRVFPTRSQEWLVGLRGRFPYERHYFSLGLGYGSHLFVIEPSGPAVAGRGNLPEIPRTEYDFLRIHAEAMLAVAGGFHVTVGGGYRVVFSAGGIEDEVWFPDASVGGVEADIVLGYQLDNGLVIRLGFDWRRYFYSMNVGLTSPWIAGGALDQYLGGSLGIAYRH